MCCLHNSYQLIVFLSIGCEDVINCDAGKFKLICLMIRWISMNMKILLNHDLISLINITWIAIIEDWLGKRPSQTWQINRIFICAIKICSKISNLLAFANRIWEVLVIGILAKKYFSFASPANKLETIIALLLK